MYTLHRGIANEEDVKETNVDKEGITDKRLTTASLKKILKRHLTMKNL